MSENSLPSPTAAVFLLVVLSGFLLFVLSIPEVDRRELLDDRNSISEEIQLLSLENLEINGYDGYKRTNIDYNTFNLNTDYEKIIYNQAKSLNLNSNLFNSKSFEFSYNPIINSNYVFSSLEFVIEEISSYGKLKVYLNDNLISEISPIENQKIIVNLDNQIQIKGNNLVKIIPSYTGLNPFNKFDIEISDLNYIENYQGNSNNYKSSFYIDENLIISEASLNYLIRSNTYDPKYSVYINDKIVINDNLGNEVKLKIPAEYIKEGINIIEYRLISNSDIDFILPKLQLLSERQFKSDIYTFQIDDRLARLIINDRVDCKLYSSSNLDYLINLNNFNLEIKDYISFNKDICNNLVYGENKMQIVSDKDLDIDYLDIVLV
ncbi:MAG: hypothetical protein VW380_01455 [Candidatus Woesearchaeota archaeon]